MYLYESSLNLKTRFFAVSLRQFTKNRKWNSFWFFPFPFSLFSFYRKGSNQCPPTSTVYRKRTPFLGQKALFSQIFKIEMVVKHALHRKDNIWNSQKLLISVLKAYAGGRTQRIWIACFLLTEFKGQKNKTCFLSQFGAVFCVCDV